MNIRKPMEAIKSWSLEGGLNMIGYELTVVEGF